MPNAHVSVLPIRQSITNIWLFSVLWVGIFSVLSFTLLFVYFPASNLKVAFVIMLATNARNYCYNYTSLFVCIFACMSMQNNQAIWARNKLNKKNKFRDSSAS